MTEAPPPTRAWRAAFAATLAAAMGIGPFAMLAVSALSPLVVADLGLSRTELGSIATVTFFLAAVASHAVGRRHVDALPGRTVLLVVFLGGGLTSLVFALAPSLPWLWSGAVIAGAALGLANLVTNQLIADHIPAAQRGLQIGLKQSGTSMALVIVGFAQPPLALLVGWRGAILTGVAFGAAGVAVVRAVVPPSEPLRDGPRAPTGARSTAVWWLGAYAFIAGVLNPGGRVRTAVLLRGARADPGRRRHDRQSRRDARGGRQGRLEPGRRPAGGTGPGALAIALGWQRSTRVAPPVP